MSVNLTLKIVKVVKFYFMYILPQFKKLVDSTDW